MYKKRARTKTNEVKIIDDDKDPREQRVKKRNMELEDYEMVIARHATILQADR